jgi:NAD(P)-dependent dehydrogenase (short-subunit alcohol dehydrogenase family)
MSTDRKVAVITGASQGIGAALADAYLERNYRVVAVSRSIQPSNNPDVLAIAAISATPLRDAGRSTRRLPSSAASIRW